MFQPCRWIVQPLQPRRLTLFGLDYVHAVSPKLKWTPHPDGVILFAEMSLDD